MSFELRIAIVIDAQLVLLARLPCQANQIVHDPLIFYAGAYLTRAREEAARDDGVGGDPSPTRKEPQFVSQDGSAHTDVDVGDRRHAGPGAQASCPQLVGHVVRLPVAAGS